MTTDLARQRAAQRMIADARVFFQFGWLMGTSGNLSVRLSDDTFLITASGRHKGELCEDDFLLCDLSGQPAEATTLRPSAETLLHCAIYRARPEAQAIYHTHDPYAALCSDRDAAAGHTTVRAVELIKGLNLWDDDATVHIPILPNPAHIPSLAEATATYVSALPREGWVMPCVNILRHGVYAWGGSAFEARRHMESLAYLFKYSWERER